MKKDICNALLLNSITVIVLISLIGCTRVWMDPDTSVPASNQSIANILVNKAAYDSAGVVVVGKVWDLRKETMTDEENRVEKEYTTFKLADRKGNYLDVYTPGNYELSEGDFVRVTGIFQIDYNDELRDFENDITAIRIEPWKPTVLFWLREFEFD